MTPDTWHVTHGVGWTFFQNFRSPALTVWDRQCLLKTRQFRDASYLDEHLHQLRAAVEGGRLERSEAVLGRPVDLDMRLGPRNSLTQPRYKELYMGKSLAHKSQVKAGHLYKLPFLPLKVSIVWRTTLIIKICLAYVKLCFWYKKT